MNKEINKNNKVIKFIYMTKKFWYLILIGVLCFGLFGCLIGINKSNKEKVNSDIADYVVLKTTLLSTNGNQETFDESFYRVCYYLMNSKSLIEETYLSLNYEDVESKIKNLSIRNSSISSNIFEINIKANNEAEALDLLNNYIDLSAKYLNKIIKNNINEDGSFKPDVDPSNIIEVRQFGDVDYDIIVKTTFTLKIIIKYSVIGAIAGLILSLLALYFINFHFIVHDVYDVVKNFNISYICKFNNKQELEDYLKTTKDEIYCFNNKEKLDSFNNSYNLDDITNNNFKNNTKNKNIILMVKEDKDTYFYIEKVQCVFKDLLKGFILYK